MEAKRMGHPYKGMDYATALKHFGDHYCAAPHYDSCVPCTYYVGRQCQHPLHPKFAFGLRHAEKIREWQLRL